MNTRIAVVSVLAVALAAAGGYALYSVGMDRGMKMAAPAASSAVGNGAAAASTDATGRKVLYWHDPMVPGQKFDKPGKSPYMSMDLVPVYADDKGSQSGVAVSARARQSLGIRTAVAEVSELRQDVSAVGYVQADERRMARAGIEYFEHSMERSK